MFPFRPIGTEKDVYVQSYEMGKGYLLKSRCLAERKHTKIKTVILRIQWLDTNNTSIPVRIKSQDSKLTPSHKRQSTQ
jgi:hypothetical protein